MHKTRFATRVALLLAALAALSETSVHAYIDPATGSYVLQMLIAGLVGAAFAVKLFWHRLVSAISGLFRRAPKPGPDGG